MTTLTTLNDLHAYLSGLPDGTTCNLIASDLEAGNFETAHFEHGGVGFDVKYTGPVAEGYASPHEVDQRAEYADALRKLKWD